MTCVSKNCNKCTCQTPEIPECEKIQSKQIDAKDVFYKISKKECFSNLDYLGFKKGESIESILESMGKYIRDFNYFDLNNNMYEAEDFSEFMTELQKNINDVNTTIFNFSEKLEQIHLTLSTIEDRLEALEKPKIIDSRGLGFTVNDNIIKVLQTLSNNG